MLGFVHVGRGDEMKEEKEEREQRWGQMHLMNGLNRMLREYFFLMNINLIEQPIPWLGHPDFSMSAAVMVNVWFGFPLFTLGILAGLQSIPSEQYH